MSRYTIRVELHDATWQNYVDLAKRLAEYGIVEVIKSGDGARYKLPPAEYNYAGDATRDQILETARRCAGSVVNSYGVLVTEAVARTWHGLLAA